MFSLIRGRLGVARLVVVVVGAACTTAPGPQGPEPQGGDRINIDSVTSLQFRAYLRTLRFAPDTESGDRQALMIGHYPESARFGPLATILPEERAHQISNEQLERGRVIARIGNESADSYPRLGLLPHAETYWWVEYNEHSKHGRSVFIAVDADTNIVGRVRAGLEVISYHREFRATQPLARFVWTSAGQQAWGWCVDHCCKTNTDSL